MLEALKAMGLLKATGTDDFPAFFSKKYWHLVGNEVIQYCIDVLNKGNNIKAIKKERSSYPQNRCA